MPSCGTSDDGPGSAAGYDKAQDSLQFHPREATRTTRLLTEVGVTVVLGLAESIDTIARRVKAASVTSVVGLVFARTPWVP